MVELVLYTNSFARYCSFVISYSSVSFFNASNINFIATANVFSHASRPSLVIFGPKPFSSKLKITSFSTWKRKTRSVVIGQLIYCIVVLTINDSSGIFLFLCDSPVFVSKFTKTSTLSKLSTTDDRAYMTDMAWAFILGEVGRSSIGISRKGK